jgi:hypothetical protein
MRTLITSITPQGAEVQDSVPSLLSAEAREAVRVDANRWIKSLRHVRYDGRDMRERFQYRSDSLWWFTELYLHKMRRLDAALETARALDAAVERHAPARLLVDTTDDAVRMAARAFGTARRVPVDVAEEDGPRTDREWQGYLVGLTARLSRWRPSRAGSIPTRPAVAAFVHTAFWQPGDGPSDPAQESYIGPVLSALGARLGPDDLFCVGVGPRRNFRARRWWDPITTSQANLPDVTPIERLAPRRALEAALELWRSREMFAVELTTGRDIRAAGVVGGVDLWPVLERELEAVALLQWPWSARAMDEAAAALDLLSPQSVLTYAEAGGWGRALVLEARRRGIRSAGIQHGFIYRHWLNYQHGEDEIAARGHDLGAPIPDRTLVFDRYAERHLREAGHFPAGSIRVTGNARLDALVARFAEVAGAGRDRVRAEFGVGQHERLVVLAAKYSEIRTALPHLVEAVGADAGVRLVIKTHPAETMAAYEPATAAAAPRVTILPPDADLARLLAAADALVTMNSTVAIDSLVLGVPALVIGLPNNLSPFVEAGVMLGASELGEIGGRLAALLYDADVRRALARQAAAFTAEHEIRSDGRAAQHAATEILSLAAAR